MPYSSKAAVRTLTRWPSENDPLTTVAAFDHGGGYAIVRVQTRAPGCYAETHYSADDARALAAELLAAADAIDPPATGAARHE